MCLAQAHQNRCGREFKRAPRPTRPVGPARHRQRACGSCVGPALQPDGGGTPRLLRDSRGFLKDARCPVPGSRPTRMGNHLQSPEGVPTVKGRALLNTRHPERRALSWWGSLGGPQHAPRQLTCLRSRPGPGSAMPAQDNARTGNTPCPRRPPPPP